MSDRKLSLLDVFALSFLPKGNAFSIVFMGVLLVVGVLIGSPFMIGWFGGFLLSELAARRFLKKFGPNNWNGKKGAGPDDVR